MYTYSLFSSEILIVVHTYKRQGLSQLSNLHRKGIEYNKYFVQEVREINTYQIINIYKTIRRFSVDIFLPSAVKFIQIFRSIL